MHRLLAWAKPHISAILCAMRATSGSCTPQITLRSCHVTESVLKQVRSVLIYDDVSKGLILPFKHADRLSLTPPLVQLLRPLFDAMASDGMIIMPVLVHKARYFSRRYNQSA
jgi:predicted amidophosphoribosyltransferase